MVLQSTSAFFSKESYWCINRTLKSVGVKNTYPYHVYVPSFGDWGFIMASNYDIDVSNFNIAKEGQYLTNQLAPSLFNFSKDQLSNLTDVSTLEHPAIMEHYLNSWKKWN